jgi:hypothetical protein
MSDPLKRRGIPPRSRDDGGGVGREERSLHYAARRATIRRERESRAAPVGMTGWGMGRKMRMFEHISTELVLRIYILVTCHDVYIALSFRHDCQTI